MLAAELASIAGTITTGVALFLEEARRRREQQPLNADELRAPLIELHQMLVDWRFAAEETNRTLRRWRQAVDSSDSDLDELRREARRAAARNGLAGCSAAEGVMWRQTSNSPTLEAILKAYEPALASISAIFRDRLLQLTTSTGRLGERIFENETAALDLELPELEKTAKEIGEAEALVKAFIREELPFASS